MWNVLIGESTAVRGLRAEVALAASTDAPVLITGEPDVGKSEVVREAHARSRRRGKSLRILECTRPTELEWMFSRRVPLQDRVGGVLGGTLCFTRTERLHPQLQDGFNQFLADTSHVDLRVIATAGGSLYDAVQRREFREDLFYRLNVIHLGVPPLRARAEDIPLLFAAFLRQAAQRRCRAVPALTREAEVALLDHCWPENLRELRLLADGIAVHSVAGPLTARDVSTRIRRGLGPCRDASGRAAASRSL